MEEEEEHVKTRSVYTYTNIYNHTTLFYSSIYLSLSLPSMYKNNFDYIINPRLVSVLFSRLRRVPSANRSIITWRKEKGEREKKKKREKTGIHACSASIYLFLYRGRTKNRRSRKREKNRKRERERQQNVAADAASASSHHSVCLYLDEKQQ